MSRASSRFNLYNRFGLKELAEELLSTTAAAEQPSSSLIIPPLFPIQQSNPIQYFDEKDCKFRVKSFSRSRVPAARAAWNHQQRSSRVLPPVTATHHRSPDTNPQHQPPTPQRPNTANSAVPAFCLRRPPPPPKPQYNSQYRNAEHHQQRSSRVLPPLPTPQRLSTANTNPQHRNA
ncbi:uncharacterized protein ATNIH1004_010632 [Aspergillus tanneri]|uniref:Uncharacterized protein n=1 Tax=Aspergillus tanneri TaxID=1220188 RepID=A0A5M9MMA6_9EURO|nr:uncharacterized protein ATNIH1004_010632 [Aspergillus tanneri]KAA8643857.1 hypothetical protein ATNIH1004_010632 [Aspergillus tanneri]